MNLQSTLLPLQQFIALNKKKIEQVFLASELALCVVLLIVGFMFLTGSIDYLPLYQVGKRIGQLSIVTYLITLTPGILVRLKTLLPISAMLTMFRRHFGILTFLMVVTHSTFIVWLPQLASSRFAWPTGFALMGAIAATLFFPMWLTSSDYAQHQLGPWWKRLHRVTYVAAFFIYLHVSMQMSDWRWPVLVFLVLEVVSWVVAWWRLLTPPVVQ